MEREPSLHKDEGKHSSEDQNASLCTYPDLPFPVTQLSACITRTYNR